MSLRRRAAVFLRRPPPGAAPTWIGRIRQALLVPRSDEIAALLSSLCRTLAGRAVLLDAEGRIRAGAPTAHQRLRLAALPAAPLLQAALGPQGLLLLGRPPEVDHPHVALAWETPFSHHLVGQAAHGAASAWLDEGSPLGLARHTAIRVGLRVELATDEFAPRPRPPHRDPHPLTPPRTP